MRIEHVAMYVNDLEKARNFLWNTSMPSRMKGIIIQKQILGPTFYPSTAGHDWK